MSAKKLEWLMHRWQRGVLKLRDYRTGRVETTQMWGRPESVRQEFRRLRSQ